MAGIGIRLNQSILLGVIMNKTLICASAAILLTGLSSTVFVSAEPNPRITAPAATRVAVAKVDQAQLERGRYLMKTAGCNDCHTPGYAQSGGQVEESKWLTGDSMGWQGPWGTTYPINLRRYMNNLTPGQWLIVARSPARPPMPWFALRDMSDEDLLAIYHFVRSLGVAGEDAPAYLPPGQKAQTPVVAFPAG
jgi:mono/diheme cytochrome c family protein